jgi:hypothetical protein
MVRVGLLRQRKRKLDTECYTFDCVSIRISGRLTFPTARYPDTDDLAKCYRGLFKT